MRNFELGLTRLRENLLSMASLVDEQFNLAVHAVQRCETAQVDEVIALDDRIDAYEVLIDEQCERLFALHQPVAIDLRLLIAAIKATNDLERVGDLSVNLAESVRHICSLGADLPMPILIAQMADLTRQMIKDTIDAFINRDAELARDVLDQDDAVDTLDHQVYEAMIVRVREHPADAVAAIDYIEIARTLERIADHATNIAEDVIFLLEARFIQHSWRNRQTDA